jgi:hypothetical protein
MIKLFQSHQQLKKEIKENNHITWNKIKKRQGERVGKNEKR